MCFVLNSRTAESENEVLDSNELEFNTSKTNSQSTSCSNDLELPGTSSVSVNFDSTTNSKTKRKRQKINKNDNTTNQPLSSERIEEIHKALSKMIAMNQMPLSFCSSQGFRHFMEVVEPNYKPCSTETLKNRLKLFLNEIKEIIKNELKDLQNVSCTTDCWTSRSQASYITITCHAINYQWKPRSFTLTTHEVEERHTALNIAHHLEKSFKEWGIKNKVYAIVTDNAANVTNAISQLEINDDMEKSGLTCAAHSLQLAVNKALLNDDIQCIITKSSKIVGHFKHSAISCKALVKMQQQLGLPKLTLLQNCKTRWNSSFLMLDRLYSNRAPIMNVLADRNTTAVSIAQKLEISESEWLTIEKLILLLKPLEALTTIFCGELQSPVSMVRPLIQKIVSIHYQYDLEDDKMTEQFKNTILYQLTTRFDLMWKGTVTARQIASFLDPRYKDIEHEPIEARDLIRSYVLKLIESIAPTIISKNDEGEKNLQLSNALAFLYKDYTNNMNDASTQFSGYLSEPQLRFDLNPLEWWRTREEKYPAVAAVAKKYLTIPSTSASSERCFSTAGNIVTSKRSCLLPENVDMLVFLYQNRKLFS